MLPSRFAVPFLGFFLFLFPKGGIKLGGIPLTWGYLFLSLATFFLLGRRFFLFSRERLLALLALLPFQLTLLLTLLLFGFTDLGYLLSLLSGFLALPLFFYLAPPIAWIEHRLFLTRGILFLSLFGILLFAWTCYSGNFFEIPLLTVNLADVGALDTKHNARGLFYKLTSTYNNGNLFGICMIMLAPLYLHFEHRAFLRWLFRISLILTLSRSVWAALLFHELLFSLLFERRRLLPLLILISIPIFFFPSLLPFLFDPTLGGRIEQIEALQTAHFFPSESFSGIWEMVYVGMAHSFGYLGLFFFCVAMGAPILLGLTSAKGRAERAAVQGMVNFLFISLSDGALLLIPVLPLYWALSGSATGRGITSPLAPRGPADRRVT